VLQRRARLLEARTLTVNVIQRPERQSSLEAALELKREGLEPIWHLATGGRTQPTLPGVEEQVTETEQGHDLPPDPPSIPSPAQLIAQLELDAPFCMTCGVPMRRAGSCYVCADCGATSGCS